MYSALLANASFHELLLDYDRDLAASTRARGCGCGGVLHSAKYPRKPRPWALMRRLGPKHEWRFSFCCAVDGCRDRATPPSLLFLGRKVYLATTVVLLCVMLHGVTERRFRRLREAIGVDRRTIARSRVWWREVFTTTAFWRSARAALMSPVDEQRLPEALLERFCGSVAERLVALLRFFLDREVRSYEAGHVGGLVQFDAHYGSKKVLTPRGELVRPILFAVLDDCSRVACHLQWYLSETAEIVTHGLSQAFQKRGLPRAGLSDNGGAMTAAEITEGLSRLGILHETTLPYTPAANGKVETLWASVEGRLIAMLEGVPDLTLAFLNEATLAWAEQDYNRKIRSEIGVAPIARFLAGPSVMRPSPDSAALRLAFTRTETRTRGWFRCPVVVSTAA